MILRRCGSERKEELVSLLIWKSRCFNVFALLKAVNKVIKEVDKFILKDISSLSREQRRNGPHCIAIDRSK
jgi:hypothetical protein